VTYVNLVRYEGYALNDEDYKEGSFFDDCDHD